MRWLMMTVVAALVTLSSASCMKRMTTLASPDDDPKDQWSRGVYLYVGNCARCHGDNGQGTEDTPSIAGPGALPRLPTHEDSARKTQFATAQHLFTYVKETMPPLDSGCLTDDELYAVMNYVLKQAEIPFTGDITSDNIADIEIPPTKGTRPAFTESESDDEDDDDDDEDDGNPADGA